MDIPQATPHQEHASGTRLKNHAAVLSALALTLAASWIYWYGLRYDPRLLTGAAVATALLIPGAALSGRRAGPGGDAVILSLSVVFLGPTWAAAAAAPHAALAERADPLRTLCRAGRSVTAAHLAGMPFFGLAPGPLLTSSPGSAAEAALGAATAAAVFLVSDAAISGILSGRPPPRAELAATHLLPGALCILTAGLTVPALLGYGPAAAAGVLAAGYAGSELPALRARRRAGRVEELEERVKSLEESLMLSGALLGGLLMRELGRRDGYAHRHAAATAVYAQDIARELGLDEERIRRLRLAALLHNIGLSGAPEDPRRHPVEGEKILSAVPGFREISTWVRWHHERPDGRGYPDGLRGPWIPPEARIISVAEAYAAMVLDRPGRPGMSYEQARSELNAGLDTRFDGGVARAFLRILETETEGYRRAGTPRFAPETTDEDSPG